MPVHFSPSSNHKEPTQLLQDKLFRTSTFNKPHLFPTSQRKPGCSTSSRTLTLPGAINFYNMRWRLAPRAICPATNVSLEISSWDLSLCKDEDPMALKAYVGSWAVECGLVHKIRLER
ncbi:hypothetical protein TNCV_1436361 [Trichonephila clavipes]|nr:hypothetical protein TNCV_1436361 [Trichonephila clavipes]